MLLPCFLRRFAQNASSSDFRIESAGTVRLQQERKHISCAQHPVLKVTVLLSDPLPGLVGAGQIQSLLAAMLLAKMLGNGSDLDLALAWLDSCDRCLQRRILQSRR